MHMQEEAYQQRLYELSIEEEARRGHTKMMLAQLAGVMGKAMYDMQKAQVRQAGPCERGGDGMFGKPRG